MTDGKILEVYYHKKTVGRLAETPDKMIAFQYDDKWLKHGFSISPLSLPLKGDVFVPNENARDRFKGLFGVFADSLPDSWGNCCWIAILKKQGLRERMCRRSTDWPILGVPEWARWNTIRQKKLTFVWNQPDWIMTP